jgi:hypothetical protein
MLREVTWWELVWELWSSIPQPCVSQYVNKNQGAQLKFRYTGGREQEDSGLRTKVQGQPRQKVSKMPSQQTSQAW